MKLIFLILLMPSLAFGAVTVTVNGSNHTIPQTNERGWGNAVTAWIQAITNYTLQPTGGTFTLTNDVNFGANYGLKSAYFSTRSANPSSAGLLRLAVGDSIGWRNNANSANLLLAVDGSNNLTFNSVVLPTVSSTSTLTNKTIDADDNTISDIANANIKAAAGIEHSKMAALTASRVLVSDGSGVVSPSSITSTTLGYLDATSSIQTQLDGKQATGNYITALTGDVTASGPGSVASTIANLAVTNAKIANSTIDLTAKVTGSLPAANGGTGQSSFTKGDLLVASAATTISKLGVGADGTVLTADAAEATGVKWGTALSNPMNASGDIIYGGVAGAATRLAKGSDGQALTLSSGLPSWVQTIPSGSVQMYVGSSAPSGWLLMNGNTIGSASSSATARANADTETLFTLLWNSMSNTDLPIQDSTGAASTRGASAAADFAANKRLPLPNTQGIFVRGAGSQTISSISYSGTLGTKQGDQMQGHYHNPLSPGTSFWGSYAGGGTTGASSVNVGGMTTTGAPVSDGTNGTPRTGSETRPANISLNYIIKI